MADEADPPRVDTSMFMFEFRLLPQQSCAGVVADRLAIGKWKIVCVGDLLQLSTLQHNTGFDALLAEAQGVAAAVVDAHAYLGYPGNQALDLEPQTWHEIFNTPERGAMLGRLYPASSSSRARNEEASGLLRRCVEFLGIGHVANHLAPALADFRIARKELGIYSAFYSFRVLEDVAYAFGSRGATRPAWKRMNEALGTSELDWKPLTGAGVEARHLRPELSRGITDAKRQKLLDLAKRCIDLYGDYLASTGPPIPKKRPRLLLRPVPGVGPKLDATESS